MQPGLAPNLLANRLSALRRRLRLVTLIRGACWLVALVLFVAILAGLLDWRVHLPGAVRAIFLAGLLSGGGIVVYGGLYRPLADRADNLTLALRIESRYPELNDSLASTVQFLEQPGPDSSTELRQAAIDEALRRARRCDFNRVIDHRGRRTSGLALIGALAVAILLGAFFPDATLIALARLGNPFGTLEWPPQTRLQDLAARSRIARGEPFEIRATVAGMIPQRAVVRFQFENAGPSEQSYPILVPKGRANTGSMSVHLEAGRVQRNFRFQVQANDAVSKWQEVTVLPPPALVPLENRPSPQVFLTFPAYTDLPAQILPDGTANIEAVAGTVVSLEAATDRPVRRAWIEYRPDQPAIQLAAFLGPLSAHHAGEALALHCAEQAACGRAPAALRSYHSGSALKVEFLPWISGTYALRLEDESGLTASRLFDVRIWSDPAPSVHLDRPSASLDSLAVLPTAEITVQVVAEDPQFAVRSVHLEYRCRKEDPARTLPLYDHQAVGRALPPLLSALARFPAAAAPLRLRPQRLDIGQRLALPKLKHLDGSDLREGDAIVLQATADDFDNVAVDKQPGRSHEIELRVVSLSTLQALLHHGEAQMQQELLRLREQQREAVKKSAAAEKQQRNTGRLRPEDLDELLQAEQVQQQIHGRIGTREEGLRADVARLLQTLRDNHLPRSGTHERMELVADELERLAQEELDQIEQLLTNARKENELAQDKPPAPTRTAGPLSKAVEHQQEVERTLTELLARLDPFSSTRQARAEGKALLSEQRKLAGQTEKLGSEIDKGIDPRDLKPEQNAELEKAAEWQARLVDHMAQLLQKMERIAAEKERLSEEKQQQAIEKLAQAAAQTNQAKQERDADPAKAEQLEQEADILRREAAMLQETAETLREEAEALRKAASQGNAATQASARREATTLEGHMKQAASDIGQNKLGSAAQEQQESIDSLEKVVKALEDRREEELDRLIKKLREAEKKLAELVEEQDRLQKKVKEARGLADSKKREAELQRLAREQEKLRKEAHEMARQLSRLRAGRAGQEMARAGDRMDDAGQELSRSQDAEDQQEDALDRLDQAQRALQQAREEAEEELAREKLAKVAELLQRLKERQEALLPRNARIHRDVLQKKRWDRGLLFSLKAETTAQAGLSQETAALGKGKLAEATVFARMLEKAADAMDKAAESMTEHFEKASEPGAELDVAAEEAAATKTERLQREALRRLEQLVLALKPEPGVAQRRQQPPPGGQPGGAPKGDSDAISQIAQLKVLRALQQEINQRTETFARVHPKPDKLTAQEKTELEGLRREEAEIMELLEKLTAPAE